MIKLQAIKKNMCHLEIEYFLLYFSIFACLNQPYSNLTSLRGIAKSLPRTKLAAREDFGRSTRWSY